MIKTNKQKSVKEKITLTTSEELIFTNSPNPIGKKADCKPDLTNKERMKETNKKYKYIFSFM